ncbi:hypothetical protein [Novosphingobium ginsenosidimutans]|uniref:hypothetical protein n=1 Tax=Novosphingobium ginsenosidimutans TaxID=1176536 RepID=UPI001376313C|nr:hypothetical protein [Novosphingobium ginsenosidimutans]
MISLRTSAEAMAVLARETAARHGPVPRDLDGITVPLGHRLITGGRYLQWTDSGYGYFHAPGAGIVIEQPEGADPDEEALWLNGSVYAGVACLKGFLPLHASAVAVDGRAIAFTGPTGAGKSTLAAGLGQLGFPLFCDDSLLVDLHNTEGLIAMPGHKRLKLLPDALALAGAVAEAPVGAATGKFYARPAAGDLGQPLPLAGLVFLETGPDVRWHEARGAERFVRLEDDHYTQELFREAAQPGRAELFALRARLAGQVTMARLVRPISAEGFAASLALAAQRIRELGR